MSYFREDYKELLPVAEPTLMGKEDTGGPIYGKE